MAGMELRRTRRGWAEPPPPPYCVNGHPLRGGVGRVLIGTQHCQVCGIHRSIRCEECGAMIFRPPRTEACSFIAMDGRPVEPETNST